MRKIVTAAAAAVMLVLGAAAPALADHNDNYPYQQGQGQYQQGPQGGYSDRYSNGPYENDDFDGYRGPRDGRFNNFNFNNQNGNFDSWERGWGNRGYDNYRHQRPMPVRKLIRALAYQGYYGARGFQQAHWGFGYRAFAFDRSGAPVMLRVNPYNGRVIDVRYVGGRRW